MRRSTGFLRTWCKRQMIGRRLNMQCLVAVGNRKKIMTRGSSKWILMLVYALSLFLSLSPEQAGADEIWKKVEKILADDQGLMVLDGTEKVSPRYEAKDHPVFGDWLVLHAFSEPASLNPYRKMDYGSHRILENMFESLLYMEKTPPYRFKGRLARAYPTVSRDKLSYTFDLRENIHFSDGRPLTAADVLFSFKLIKIRRSSYRDLRGAGSRTFKQSDRKGPIRSRLFTANPISIMRSTSGGSGSCPNTSTIRTG